MDAALERKILNLLDEHRIMTVATLRPDGWPQATTVGFVSEGLTLYFICGRDSQKARNLARDDRVSLTIDHDTPATMAITGLSMAAHSAPVADPAAVRKVLALLAKKYPEYLTLPAPDIAEIAVYRLAPKVVSVLDYTKGFGHTDLVTL